MNNEQLLVIVGVPILWNTLLYMAFAANMNKRFEDSSRAINQRFDDFVRTVDSRFAEFTGFMDRRFQAAEATWRAELHRVEEVLDARLKHLEDR